MLKLYIVRHGETEYNVQKRMQGSIDSPLTERGRAHAVDLRDHLKEVHFDRIYSSPSERACRTAEIIRGKKTTPIEVEAEFREMNLVHWEGKSKEELTALYPEEYDRFWNEPQLHQLEGGHTFYEVQERVIAMLQKLIHENKSGNILIVTHSVVILTISVFFRQLPIEKLWEPPYIHDTSVTLLTAEKGAARLEYIGDISHIR